LLYPGANGTNHNYDTECKRQNFAIAVRGKTISENAKVEYIFLKICAFIGETS
jgi:hypothetical protein